MTSELAKGDALTTYDYGRLEHLLNLLKECASLWSLGQELVDQEIEAYSRDRKTRHKSIAESGVGYTRGSHPFLRVLRMNLAFVRTHFHPGSQGISPCRWRGTFQTAVSENSTRRWGLVNSREGFHYTCQIGRLRRLTNGLKTRQMK